MNEKSSEEQKETLRIKRKENMRKLTKKIQVIENQKLLEEIEEMENGKDDSNKMFKAISKSSMSKPKEAIVVETENGNTTNEEESMKIVTDWFERVFKAENETKFLEVPPKEMKIPFTRDEVSMAIKSLKVTKVQARTIQWLNNSNMVRR